jgi:hypothetical protein
MTWQPFPFLDLLRSQKGSGHRKKSDRSDFVRRRFRFFKDPLFSRISYDCVFFTYTPVTPFAVMV